MAIIKPIPESKEKKLTALDIEIAVADYFNWRQNIIVPNINWGMFVHECDVLVLTKAACLYEIEIKVSKHDLIRDKKKKHGHVSNKIKRLYFAIPYYLADYTEHIPERAGIISVDEVGHCTKIREAENNKVESLQHEDCFNMARLGTMRIWTLKNQIRRLKEKGNDRISE